MSKDLVKREEPIIKLKRVKEPETSVEERNIAYETKMEKAKLEAAKLKAARMSAELEAAHDENDLMCLQAVKSGASSLVPKRRS
jgi:hypothetical protein